MFGVNLSRVTLDSVQYIEISEMSEIRRKMCQEKTERRRQVMARWFWTEGKQLAQ